MERIGIYGGTFNPPHLGHQAAAETAVKVLGLDKLILIPAAVPPHKQLPEHTPDKIGLYPYFRNMVHDYK